MSETIKPAGVIVTIQSPDAITERPFGGQVATYFESMPDLDALLGQVKETASDFWPEFVIKESVQIVVTLTVRDHGELAMRHCAAVDLLIRGKDALPIVGQRFEPWEKIDRDQVVPSRDSLEDVNTGVAEGIRGGHVATEGNSPVTDKSEGEVLS